MGRAVAALGVALAGCVLVAASSSGGSAVRARDELALSGGAAAGAMPTASAPSRNEPPVGFSGGFGEPTCQSCHFEADVNPSPGSLTLQGAPERYTPGESYRVEVVLTRPGMAIAGFELTARFAEGGAQAGSLAPAPGREADLKVSTSFDVQYAHHLRAGTEVVRADTARWAVVWTAPPQGGGKVLFHAAANAANADDSQLGDYVYTAQAGSEGPGR